MFQINAKFTRPVIYNDRIDPKAVKQLKNVCDQPLAKATRVALMPDGHVGAGVPIGTTMRLMAPRNDWRISPTVISGDIGCGVLATRIQETKVDYPKLDRVIATRIPAGYHVNQTPVDPEFSQAIGEQLTFRPNQQVRHDLFHSLGSLGSGNHFIELDRDRYNRFWIVIHCGSRHFGTDILDHYLKVAHANRHDPYATLSGTDLQHYLHDTVLAQKFAARNRKLIVKRIVNGMNFHVAGRFQSVHNYFNPDDHVLRKGAVTAHKNEKIIIPLNMRDGALICVGKGNPAWNYSAPHGAGRELSRIQARKRIPMRRYRIDMGDVYTTSVGPSTLDEAPEAYKPMQEIIDNLTPTAKIIDRLIPLYNYKAH